MPTLYDTAARLKAQEMNYSTSTDFELGGEREAPGRLLLEQPGWSPYCLDHTTHEAIFVRVPAGTDLAKAPFYFVEQYRNATQLLKLPLAELEALTAALPDPAVAIIYSMGRCGTTLASHALNESPHAWSLSEPEVFNHRSLMLPPDAPVAAGTLVRSFIRLIYAQRAKPEATALVLKLRSQSLFHMRSFIDARPDARAVFMYRDALSWSQSIYQFLANFDWELSVPRDNWLKRWDFFSGGGPLEQMGRYLDLEGAEIGLAAMIAAGWMVHLDTYLERLGDGVQLLATRYNDLTADRAGEIAKLYRHAGLGEDGLDRAMGAFDEDSQKGISIGRRDDKRRLSDQQLAEMHAVFARNPRFSNPDLILPDVYSTKDSP